MTESILLADITRMWYALPLVISISLVYGATRHELVRPILDHAFRTAAWIVGFMGILFVVIWLVTRSL